jgi:hypothetical protein
MAPTVRKAYVGRCDVQVLHKYMWPSDGIVLRKDLKSKTCFGSMTPVRDIQGLSPCSIKHVWRQFLAF